LAELGVLISEHLPARRGRNARFYRYAMDAVGESRPPVRRGSRNRFAQRALALTAGGEGGGRRRRRRRRGRRGERKKNTFYATSVISAPLRR